MNTDIVKEFFDTLNENIQYIVLRNWEDIYNPTSDFSHEDIDILCSDLNAFKKIVKTVPIHDNAYRDNYFVIIKGQKIRVDIRHVGDGYYPVEFQKQLLQERNLDKNGLYIPSVKTFYYSLLYHALLQKKVLSVEYTNKLNAARIKFEDTRINSNKEFLDELKYFLMDSGFTAPMPHDPGVYINLRNSKYVGMTMDFKSSVQRLKLNFSSLFKALKNKICILFI